MPKNKYTVIQNRRLKLEENKFKENKQIVKMQQYFAFKKKKFYLGVPPIVKATNRKICK